MDHLIELAAELGTAIRESRQFQDLREAETAVQSKPDLTAMVQEYQSAATAVYDKEKKGQPVEPEEKRRLQELQLQVSATPELQALARLQADYAELMNGVNAAIQNGLWPDASGNGETD